MRMSQIVYFKQQNQLKIQPKESVSLPKNGKKLLRKLKRKILLSKRKCRGCLSARVTFFSATRPLKMCAWFMYRRQTSAYLVEKLTIGYGRGIRVTSLSSVPTLHRMGRQPPIQKIMFLTNLKSI